MPECIREGAENIELHAAVMDNNSIMDEWEIVANSQKIFSVEYPSQADFKIYVVDYKSQADLNVYKVDYSSQSKGNKGLWVFGDYQSPADKKI